MKKVLFVTNYRNALAPVIQVLKDDPDSRIIALFPPPKDFDEESNLDGNLEYRELRDFTDVELDAKIENSLIEFGEKIRRLEETIPLIESNPIESSNCDWRLIKEDYFNFASKFICQIPILERLFEIVKPDLVCGACEPSAMTVISFKLAQVRKIPVLLIQHGMYFVKPWDVFWRNDLTGENLHNTDKMAIWGEIVREKFIEAWGEEIDHKLVITGSPQLDFYFNLRGRNLEEKRIRFCRDYGLDHTKKLIMLGLNSRWRDIAFVIKETKEAIKQLPGCQLFLRVNPGDSLEIYQEICKELKIKIPIVRDEDKTICLMACDVLITTPTTLAIEALLLEKPVISFRPTWQTHLTCGYVEEKAAIEVGNAAELKDALEYILYQKDDYEREFLPHIKRYIFRENYKFDGKASERVCALIKEMMRN